MDKITRTSDRKFSSELTDEEIKAEIIKRYERLKENIDSHKDTDANHPI